MRLLKAMFFSVFAMASVAASSKPLCVISAQTIDEPPPIIDTIATTLDFLRDELPEIGFEMRYHARGDLQSGAKSALPLLFITDPVTFSKVQESTQSWALASMKNPLAIDGSHTTGATFITRADRHDIQSILDMQGKKLAAQDAGVYESYLIGLEEIRRIFGRDDIFKEEHFTGAPIERVVHSVLASEADVGIIDACLLEQMENSGNIEKGAIRVIGERHSNDLRCRHSTNLYPGWVMAVSVPQQQLTDEQIEIIVKIHQALSRVPVLPNSFAWTYRVPNPEEFAPLAKRKAQSEQEVSLRDFALRYWKWVFAILAVLIACILHSIRASWLVRRRTGELETALDNQKALEREISKVQERIETMQRSGIVGQVSSMIAHELQQPLNAIVQYARGIRIRVERRTLTEASLLEAVLSICDQGELAAGIVSKVRGYAKRNNSERSICNLSEVLQESVKHFLKIHPDATGITVAETQTVLVDIDSFEIELLVFNLLKKNFLL